MLPPVLTVVIALLAQAPAGAPTPQSAAPSTPPAPASSNLVCKSEAETGSRFTHRVCHTPEEWRAISGAASDSVSKMQQMGGMTGGPH